MGKIIAVVNQKGGVGKTTTTVNLTSAVGAAGKKCLLVDLDPQGNATSGVGVDKRSGATSVYELLIGKAEPLSAVQKTPFENVDVLPSSMQLAGAEIELVEIPRRESRGTSGSVRLLVYRLPAVARLVDTQRFVRCRYAARADPVRILRARGSVAVDGDGAAGQAPL